MGGTPFYGEAVKPLPIWRAGERVGLDPALLEEWRPRVDHADDSILAHCMVCQAEEVFIQTIWTLSLHGWRQTAVGNSFVPRGV